MIYHSKYSSEFVGLRTSLAGGKQVVCETKNGRRILMEIRDLNAPDAQIEAALKEGINSRNVLSGVVSALKARDIAVEIAD